MVAVADAALHADWLDDADLYARGGGFVVGKAAGGELDRVVLDCGLWVWVSGCGLGGCQLGQRRTCEEDISSHCYG